MSKIWKSTEFAEEMAKSFIEARNTIKNIISDLKNEKLNEKPSIIEPQKCIDTTK